MRQLAEWGMQAFQSSMPHIKDRTNFETHGEQKMTLLMMILLYIYQAKTVGINQLQSFYAGPLDRNANVDFVLPVMHNWFN